METARDEWADEVEREHEHLVGLVAREETRREQQAEVGGHTGVRDGGDVPAPAELAREPFDTVARRAVGQVRLVAVPAKRVEAADPEIAAGDDDRPARGAPASAGNRGGHLAQRGQPVGRSGFVQKSARGEREGNEFAAIAAKHGTRLQGAFAPQQGGMCIRDITEGGEATGGREAR